MILVIVVLSLVFVGSVALAFYDGIIPLPDPKAKHQRCLESIRRLEPVVQPDLWPMWRWVEWPSEHVKRWEAEHPEYGPASLATLYYMRYNVPTNEKTRLTPYVRAWGHWLLGENEHGDRLEGTVYDVPRTTVTGEYVTDWGYKRNDWAGKPIVSAPPGALKERPSFCAQHQTYFSNLHPYHEEYL